MPTTTNYTRLDSEVNYRHIYHAGNFADVVKHLVLIALLDKISEKDKGFTSLDAFAGLGIYDLCSEESQKTKEYENGIGMFDQNKTYHHPTIDKYIEIIKRANSHNKNSPYPTLYPGSPHIIARMLRKQDNLIATELHPQDYAHLRYNLSNDITASFSHIKNIATHHMDGYNAIKAFIPPKTSRGIVLMDAAFEVQNEYKKLIEGLKLINKRFSAGIVMVWYPIKDKKLINEFYTSRKNTGYKEFIKIEFEINANIAMNKCGILIANPPYIKESLESMLESLVQNVYQNQAQYSIEII